MNEQNKRCKGCYFLGLQGSCSYIFIMDRRRPCPPGEACKEYCTRKEMDMRKASWNTEEGKKMWQAGMSDAGIADYFRIPTGTVTSYRLKHWVTDKKRAPVGEPKRPAQIEEASAGKGDHGSPLQCTVRPTEPEAGACSQLSGFVPIQEIVNRNETTPQSACLADSSPDEGSLDTAAHNDGEKKASYTVPVPRLDELDVVAAATEHLSGMKAVCTACAIQALWYWTGPADLRRAKKNIDWLLDHVEG